MWPVLFQEAAARYLEVQVQDSHLVHEEDPITDLPDEQHGIHLSQMVVLIHDPLKELAALDAVCTDPLQTGCGLPALPPSPGSHSGHSLFHEQDDLM